MARYDFPLTKTDVCGHPDTISDCCQYRAVYDRIERRWACLSCGAKGGWRGPYDVGAVVAPRDAKERPWYQHE
jgi:hypothetical protein